ncbi:MAG TPA: MarR family transcriptional regulator [Pseudolysinimonas sp.]|nr:MarR family transcriptional regulator [Pseudolysinimonas sp.]
MSEVEDGELRLLLQKVARRIRNNRTAEQLSDSQLGVLFQLETHGDCSPGSLADHERVSPPSMNRTLNGLELAGYIARSPATDDARRVRVSLTDAGQELLLETRRLRTAWFSRRLAELSSDERRALDAVAPILRKLADE